MTSLPKRRRSSRSVLFRPRSLLTQGRGRGPLPSPGASSQWVTLVSPFVVASCPAPPVGTQTDPPLPCSAPAAFALLLRPHSPAGAFQSPRGTNPEAPVTGRPLQRLPG